MPSHENYSNRHGLENAGQGDPHFGYSARNLRLTP